MKTPEEALAEVARRLGKTWSQVVDGAGWASDFRLGTSGLTGQRLASVWPETQQGALRWATWGAAAGDGVAVLSRPATVHGTTQPLPATLVVETIDVAARLVGGPWPERLAQARRRRDLLAARFPHLDDVPAVLRTTAAYSDVDFDLLCRTSTWFAEPHAEGLTARQIPVEGLGTKWLAARESVVRRLAGLDALALEPGRPSRIHLTYLDPAHLSAGGRRHDVATHGDDGTVAYQPQVVVISENRDTAQMFPALEGGIAIEGEGRGARAVAGLPWVRHAAVLWYWGDMDADGLEILHGFRAAGLPVRSLFMDVASYERWERYGVDHDHHGQPIGPREPRDVSLLESEERDLYLALCSAEWTRHRRIEQERIPLADAAAVVRGASVDSLRP